MLNPLVKKLEWLKIPRYIGVFVVYLGLLAVIVLFFLIIIPPTIAQLQLLIDNLPNYAETLRQQIESWKSTLEGLNLPIDVSAQAGKLADRLQVALVDLGPLILAYSINFVGAFSEFFIVVVISIYMLLDAKRIGRFVRSLFPKSNQTDAEEFIQRTQTAVTHWIQAQALLSFLIGASTGFGIWLLGVIGIWPEGAKYSVFFGAWAGLTEFIPYLGPILGAIPPVVTALFASPWAALAVVGVFIFIQEVEAHILVPNIMGSVVGVHPLVVIFAMLAGAEIRGIVGIILALPLVALGREIVAFFKKRISFEKWQSNKKVAPVEQTVKENAD
jgi:predicted PurR-regulated permease PerM